MTEDSNFDSEWKEQIEHKVGMYMYIAAWHVKMNTWVGKCKRRRLRSASVQHYKMASKVCTPQFPLSCIGIS